MYSLIIEELNLIPSELREKDEMYSEELISMFISYPEEYGISYKTWLGLKAINGDVEALLQGIPYSDGFQTFLPLELLTLNATLIGKGNIPMNTTLTSTIINVKTDL